MSSRSNNTNANVAAALFPYRKLDLSTTGQVIKATPGVIFAYYISNHNATASVYVKFYDKATTPTQFDTPIWTLEIPAGSAANLDSTSGIRFAAGISVRASTGVGDTDNTAPTSGDVTFNAGYR